MKSGQAGPGVGNLNCEFDPLLARLAQEFQVAMCLCDLDGRVVHANSVFFEWTGLESERMDASVAVWDLFGLVDQNGAKQAMRQLEKEGRFGPLDFEIKNAKGQAIHIRAHGHLAESESGPSFWLACQDISKDVQRLDSLIRILNTIPSLIAYWDHNMVNQFANNAYQLYFGKSPSEMLGHSLLDFLGPELFAMASGNFAQAMAGNEVKFDRDIKIMDGRIRRAMVSYTPDVVEGRVQGVIAVTTDVTDFAEMNRKLVEREKNLQGVLAAAQFREETLRGIFENSPLGVILMSSDFRYLRVNSAFESFSGYSSSELEKMSMLDITHPDDVENTRTVGTQFPRQSGVLKHFEKRYIHKSGKVIWGRVTSRVVFDDQGSFIYVSNIEDITDEKMKEDELRKSELERQRLHELNAAIFRSARFALISTDEKGIITGFNEEAERILGYSASELIGHRTPEMFHDAKELAEYALEVGAPTGLHSPNGLQVLLARADQGIPEERDWSYIAKDGRRIPVHLSVTSLKDGNNRTFGYFGVAKDITHELEVNRALDMEHAKMIRNAKMASLGEMSAGVAHEINNPLAIISGYASLLKRFRNDEVQFAAKVQGIERAAGRIAKIVLGLRKFSRSSDVSKRDLTKLNDILTETIQLTEINAKKFDVQVRVDLDPDLMIIGDDSELEQVFINLVHNAFDAVKGNSERWVQIRAINCGDKVKVQVIDSGNGISAEIEEKIFSPFFTTKGIGQGTGLGLSISKGIIEEHGGTILVNRDVANTCLEVVLPKAKGVANAA